MGRNQKFTSKNSRSKNSPPGSKCRLRLLAPAPAPGSGSWLRLLAPAPSGSVRSHLDEPNNAGKVTDNKRTQQQKNIFAKLFFCRIVICKQKQKSKLNFAIYIRYEKFLQKYQKKICKVNFLLYLCTRNKKQQHHENSYYLRD